MERHAFVTLVATDSYASGALVLAHALRNHNTTKELACLVTPTVADEVLDQLSKVFDHIIQVESLDSQAYENLLLLGRLDLGVTLTKLGLWLQTQFDKVVFLDADTLPLRNVDELFERPEFSAAPDAGWPDCFNSGVFVAKPNETTYDELLKMVKETGSFDGGDQGLLNTYFSDWSTSDPSHRLPFTYNTTPTAVYSYLPAYTVNQNNIAIIHFIGAEKPWHWMKFSDGSLFPKGNASASLVDLARKWWDVWEEYYGDASPVRTSKYDIPPIFGGDGPQANNFSVSRYTSVWGSQRPKAGPPASMPPLSDPSKVDNGWSAPHDPSFWIDVPPVIEQPYQPPLPKQFDSKQEQGFINWNPAFEGPPDSNEPINLPSFETYSNAWDRPFVRDVFMPQMYHWPRVVEGIAPPPKYDPSMLPQDYVQRIFPWEASSYELRPTRIWLDEEAARWGKDDAIRREREKEAEAAAAAAAAAVGRRDSGYNEPMRDDMRFVNAWDTVPSISKYMARVQGDIAERKISLIDNDQAQHTVDDGLFGGPQEVSVSSFTAVPPKEISPASLVGRTKNQMYADNTKTGPTPYTSAAASPTHEYALPPEGTTTTTTTTTTTMTMAPAGHSAGEGFDPNDFDWASDLKQPSQVDVTLDEAESSRRPRTGFDVTPSITPPSSSKDRHHARVPSERARWDPDEALQDVRQTNIFGEIEGGEVGRGAKELQESFAHDEDDDLGALGFTQVITDKVITRKDEGEDEVEVEVMERTTNVQVWEGGSSEFTETRTFGGIAGSGQELSFSSRESQIMVAEEGDVWVGAPPLAHEITMIDGVTSTDPLDMGELQAKLEEVKQTITVPMTVRETMTTTAVTKTNITSEVREEYSMTIEGEEREGHFVTELELESDDSIEEVVVVTERTFIEVRDDEEIEVIEIDE